MPHEQTPGDSANAEPVFLTIPTRSSSRGGVSLTNKQTKQLSPHLRCPAAHAVNKNNTNNSWELMNIWRWSSRVGLDFSPLQDSVRDRVYCSHGWTGSYGIWGTNMAELLRTESGDKRHFYLLLNKSTVLRIRTFFFFPPWYSRANFVILIGQHTKIHHPETSAIGCCASMFFILFIIISYFPDGLRTTNGGH